MKTTIEKKELENFKIEKWDNILKKSRRDFIMKYGVIRWGGLMAIICSITLPLISYLISSPDKTLAESFFSQNTLIIVGLSATLFPISGYFLAASVWKIIQKNQQSKN